MITNPLLPFARFLGIALWMMSISLCSAFTISWDASPDPTVLGYRVYYGTSSGNYTTTLDVGKANSAVIADPPVGVTYYAVVTAYAAASIESLPSQEVSYTPTGGTVSANANLSALTLSAGPLTPAFASGTTSYSASVSNTTTSVTVTPLVAQANAAVKVNGASVTSGTPSAAINLAVGTTTITTVVTAQDGTTTKAYTLTIIRAASNSADLTSLASSAGTLSPAFASGTTSYSIGVPNTTTSINFTPVPAQTGTTVRVNGVIVPAGATSQAINLGVGMTPINVALTAQDGTTTKTYTVAVTRALSGNANLASLTVSAGTLSPAFASGTTSYSLGVPNTTTSINFTPVPAQAGTTVRVNGVIVPAGATSQAINLGVGMTPINVALTAQDGTTTKTYTVAVTRALSGNANLASLTVSAGTLSPAFVSGTTSYSDSVPSGTTSIAVTPTVAQFGATVRVNGFTVVSGTPSPSIAVSTGGTTVTIVVTAPDSTTKTYTVAVTPQSNSDVAGNYYGLASPTKNSTNPARHIGLGIITVSATGAFTGKITLGGSSTAVAFSGTFGAGSAGVFSPSNTATLSIPRTDLPTLSLALNLDRQIPVASRISGTLTDDTGVLVSTLELDRSFYTDSATAAGPMTAVPSSLRNPDTDKGAYTAVFQARTPAQLALAATAFPQGDGWATMTVQPNGSVSVTGKLADGQAFTYSSYLTKGNVLPLYLTPYSGRGTVTGSLTFRDVTTQSDVDGVAMQWFKPANSKDTSYRQGWPNGIQVDLIGSKFVSPLLTGKTPLGNDPVTSPNVNACFMLGDGGLVTPTSNDLAIGMTSRATVLTTTTTTTTTTTARNLAVSLSSTGAVSGSFSHPTWSTTPTFSGVVMQKTQTAGGYFLARRSRSSTFQSGTVAISPASTPAGAVAAN